jgi:hypothetical protein
VLRKGDFVKLSDDIGVVVKTGEELEGDLADHTGVWFGTYTKGSPEVWTVPTELLEEAPEPVVKH